MHVSGHNDKLDTNEEAIIKTAAADIKNSNVLHNINPYSRLINMKWRNLQMHSGETPKTQHSLWSSSPPCKAF